MPTPFLKKINEDSPGPPSAVRDKLHNVAMQCGHGLIKRGEPLSASPRELGGWAPPALLGSYEAERRPVALDTIAEAARNMATLGTGLTDPKLMGDTAEFGTVLPSVRAAIQRTGWPLMPAAYAACRVGQPVLGRVDRRRLEFESLQSGVARFREPGRHNGGPMAAGMKDVATLAGVAVGTVSNVLNHPDLVRPQTRARVEAAMEQLGFIPNASARQLRAGRSRCLGLVVLDVTNPFFTEVARGAEDFAQAEGYAVILCNSDEAEPKERQYLRVLEEQRVRGILITPVHGRAPALHGIRDRGTPVVLLDRPGPAGQCSVAVDDRRGGELAVAHLLALGHRRIALVNGPLAIRQCADRRRGAYQAIIKAGLDPAAVLLEVQQPAGDRHRRSAPRRAARVIRRAGPALWLGFPGQFAEQDRLVDASTA